MIYYSIEHEDRVISPEKIRKVVIACVESAGQGKPILIIPPDITRLHSGAGIITEMIWNEYRDKVKDILPATGTHKPMSKSEINRMYGNIPYDLFRVHNCRKDIITLGKIPASFIKEVSEGKLDYDWPVQVNKLIGDHSKSLIISVGQVVPHEVTGMANYNKNVYIGCGGYESINKSHFLGAVYGIERTMGKTINPVREVINQGDRLFGKHLNILYILTVVDTGPEGRPAIKGLFIGSDIECYTRAASFSSRLNISLIKKAPDKMVVFLNPFEYRSTWLGNKAIYRTRMAIADNGELVIVAPGLREFGEDRTIDMLIRKYGYRTSGEIMQLVKENQDLRDNLSVPAHLIHGSTEKRFRVIYCTEKMSEDEIRSAGFDYADLLEIKARYDLENIGQGFNINRDGEEFYFISNPGLGLWIAEKNRNNQDQ
jgi:nickel-dependent lactate racemase